MPQVVTLKLIWQTRDRWTVLLVVFVETIIISVTNPALRDAMAGSRTRELIVSASFLATRVAFIGTIAAVIFRVAFPSVGDAAAVFALELGGAAGHVHAAGLVAEVPTVVFSVALECHGDAAARLALEFVGSASWFLKKGQVRLECNRTSIYLI